MPNHHANNPWRVGWIDPDPAVFFSRRDRLAKNEVEVQERLEDWENWQADIDAWIKKHPWKVWRARSKAKKLARS